MSSLLEQYPALEIIQALAKKRKVSAYLVGGFLRDYLLGKAKADLDFAVSKNAIALAREFANKIQGAFVLLDQERGCARVVKKTNGQAVVYDFSDYRAKTFEGDLSRRDFTINTFALALSDCHEADIYKKLIDRKSGLKDLKAKRIRMVSSKAFEEDPLRMLRAFSLRAALGFTIDKKTLARIKKDRSLIRKVSYERVNLELFKILESDSAHANFQGMDAIGLLEKVIPQISVMFKCKQGGYHHLDVWPHSLEVLKQLELVFVEMKNNADVQEYIQEKLGGDHSRKALMKFAALLHDIGKPDTRKVEKDRTSFHGHEHVGKNITRLIAKMLKLSVKERHVLEDLVLYHLRPGYLSNFKQPSEKAVYRYFRDTKDEAGSVLLLSLADQRSTRGPLTTEGDQKHHEKIGLKLLKIFFDKKKEKPFVRLIDGHDLIKKFRLKPSKLIGDILQKVTEHQSLGKIKTKEEAFALAKEVIPLKGSVNAKNKP